MFLALLAFWMLRFLFIVATAMVAIVLAFAALIGVSSSGIISLVSEERGEQLHHASLMLINGAIEVGKVAEGRRE